MKKLYGHELDLEQSSDGTDDFFWRLVFTKGQFQGPGVIRTVEPAMFNLKRSEYDSPLPLSYYIYYNPLTNKYQLVQNDEKDKCNDLGYMIGGFIVSGCRLMFLQPKCTEDLEYIRPFSESFDQAYEKRNISCEDFDDFCGAFRDDSFTNGFEIDCPIVEDTNAFDYGQFDPEEFETKFPDINPN